MKSRLKIFDFGLYKEALRRTKLLGIMFLLIGLAIVFVSNYILLKSGGDVSFFAEDAILNIYRMNPASTVLYIVGFFMSLQLFSGIMRRNSSDFIHALPHKRETMVISEIAAIITWIAGIFIATTAMGAIMTVLNPFVSFVPDDLFLLIVIQLCMTLMLIGAALIGVSLSGTMTATFVIAFFILFGFRIFCNSIVQMVLTRNPLLNANSLTNILSQDINILWAFWGNIESDLKNISGVLPLGVQMVYSWGVAILLIVLGIVFFKKRQSEAAGQVAISGWLQATMRIAMTMLVSLIPIALWISLQEVPYSEGTGVFTSYIFVGLFYFVYEAIMTKNLKSVVKSLKTVWIVIALNILILVGVNITIDNSFNFMPEAENVESITINRVVENEYAQYSEAALFAMEGVVIKDEETIELLTDLLRDLTTEIEEYNPEFYDDWGILTKIKMDNGTTKLRNLYLNETVRDILLKKMSKNDDYQKNIMKIEINNFSGIGIEITDNTHNNFEILSTQISKAQMKKLINLLQRDIDAMGYEKCLEALDDTRIQSSEKMVFVAHLKTNISHVANVRYFLHDDFILANEYIQQLVSEGNEKMQAKVGAMLLQENREKEISKRSSAGVWIYMNYIGKKTAVYSAIYDEYSEYYSYGEIVEQGNVYEKMIPEDTTQIGFSGDSSVIEGEEVQIKMEIEDYDTFYKGLSELVLQSETVFDCEKNYINMQMDIDEKKGTKSYQYFLPLTEEVKEYFTSYIAIYKWDTNSFGEKYQD